VGAGLADLNALFVASRYLSRDQKVILVDRRQRVGGMWADTYSYVRLYQPHSIFTAGNIKWTLNKDRSYLATKPEVIDHFAHCLNVIKQRVHVEEFFGCEFESHEETGANVRIACRSADGHPLVIEAKRLIKAYGFRVTPNDPLHISKCTRALGVSRLLRRPPRRDAGQRHPGVDHRQRKVRDGHCA
jgi:cation diffusion facilitator CzcD-associated flavoprotein CzcO